MIQGSEPNRARLSAGEMAYVDLGEADAPAVLLVHGYPTSSILWRREAWLLAQRMRVIVPDLLGYGRSDKPVDADLTEPAQAAYLGELLEGLGVREVAVVGHALGGAIAQMVALDGPVAVKALVLLDSACFEAWPIEAVRLIQGALPGQETARFVEDIVRAAFDLGVRRRAPLEEATIRDYLEPWRGDPAAFFRATRAISGKGLAGREDDLRRLPVEAFVLWGEDDPFLPAELAERLQEALPGSTLALLPGCSHFVTEEAPQTVGPLVFQYLRTHYIGTPREDLHPPAPVEVFLERPPAGFADEDAG